MPDLSATSPFIKLTARQVRTYVEVGQPVAITPNLGVRVSLLWRIPPRSANGKVPAQRIFMLPPKQPGDSGGPKDAPLTRADFSLK